MKAANPGIVWQWQCDYCYRYFGPKAVSESELPSYAQMIADGWSIGKVHGDVCPSCMADGVQASSERHPAVEAAVRADMAPRVVSTVEELDNYPDGSVFLNSRGHVVYLDTIEFAPEEPLRVYFSIGIEEDWPLDRLGFPATVLWVPVTPGGKSR